MESGQKKQGTKGKAVLSKGYTINPFPLGIHRGTGDLGFLTVKKTYNNTWFVCPERPEG